MKKNVSAPKRCLTITFFPHHEKTAQNEFEHPKIVLILSFEYHDDDNMEN